MDVPPVPAISHVSKGSQESLGFQPIVSGWDWGNPAGHVPLKSSENDHLFGQFRIFSSMFQQVTTCDFQVRKSHQRRPVGGSWFWAFFRLNSGDQRIESNSESSSTAEDRTGKQNMRIILVRISMAPKGAAELRSCDCSHVVF